MARKRVKWHHRVHHQKLFLVLEKKYDDTSDGLVKYHYEWFEKLPQLFGIHPPALLLLHYHYYGTACLKAADSQ